ncbi:MAG TPA: hypothetical protein VM510_12505 [Caulifigura sp.]|jgi:hypothetical protein|nr:hypothetical protein [Caulifigura sp.]
MTAAVVKPVMTVRLGRAAVWLVPFLILGVLRASLGVPNEFLAMPANGIPPTRLDGVINVLFAASAVLGLEGFLARLVWDDSAGLAVLMGGLMILQAIFTGVMLVYVAVS